MYIMENERIERCLQTHMYEERNDKIDQYILKSIKLFIKNQNNYLNLIDIFGIDIEKFNNTVRLCGKIIVEIKYTDSYLRNLGNSFLRKIPFIARNITNGYYVLDKISWTKIIKYLYQVFNINSIKNSRQFDYQLNNIYNTEIKNKLNIRIFWKPNFKPKSGGKIKK